MDLLYFDTGKTVIGQGVNRPIRIYTVFNNRYTPTAARIVIYASSTVKEQSYYPWESVEWQHTSYSIMIGSWYHLLFAINVVSLVGWIRLNANIVNSGTGTLYYSDDGPFAAMPYSGFPFGLPVIPDSLDNQKEKVAFADVQIWLNTYIDPTSNTNFAKFVQIVDGKGYPVSPSIATTAFGTQTFLFKGKSSDNSFYFNRGNGGSFSKIGTISDFTPTPSY